MTDLGTAKGKIEVDASGAEKGVKDAEKAVTGLGKSSKSSSAGLIALGGGMAAVGASAVAGFGMAVSAASGFEKELSAFGTVAEGTADQMDAIREKALQVGRDTAWGAGQAAGAMTELAKAGVPVEGILNGAADATVALASAGEIDLARAASISAAALNQFKLEAEDLPGVADLLAGAANASATGVTEIGLAFEYVGPVANAAGMSIEDTAGAIAVLSNNGIDAGKAGTSLRSIITQLIPTTERAAGAMSELGLIAEDGTNQFYNADGSLKDFNEIVGLLNGSMRDLSEAERIMYSEAMFGREALSAVSAIAGTTTEEFDALQATIGDVSATDVAEGRLDNLAGSITILKGTIETFLISAGTPFLSGLKGIVDVVTQGINVLASLSPQVQKVAGFIVFGTGAVIGLIGAMILATKYIQTARIAFQALNTAFLTNPIFLVIAALVAIGAALVVAYKRSETFRNIVNGAFEAVKNAIQPVLDWVDRFVDVIKTMWRVFQDGNMNLETFARGLDMAVQGGGRFTGIFRAIGSVIKTAFDWVMNFVGTIQRMWNVFKSGNMSLGVFATMMDNAVGGGGRLRDIIKSVAGFITDTLIPALSTVAGWIRQAFGFVVNEVLPFALAKFRELVAFFQAEWPAIQEAVTHVFNAIMDVIKVAIVVIREVIGVALDILQALWRAWGDEIVSILQIAWAFIQEIINAGMQIIQGVISTVLAVINGDWGDAWDGIKQILGGVWDAMFAVVRAAIGLVLNIITGTLGTIQQVWNGVWDKVSDFLKRRWDTIKEDLSRAIEVVLGFFKSLWGNIKSALGDLAGAIGGFFKDAFWKIVDAATEMSRDLLQFYRDLPGNILDALGDLGSYLFSAGKDLIRGLINGVKNMAGNAAQAAKDAVSGAVGAAKDFLGIGSPSKVFMEIGSDTIEGLTIGLDKNGNDPRDTIRNILSSMTPPPPPMAMSYAGSGGVTVNFNIEGVSAEDAEEIKKTVTSPEVLAKVVRAARAGRTL